MAQWGEIVRSMLGEHWFWGGLMLLVLVWYSTVTVYVAVKGTGDIRSMLHTLRMRKKTMDNGRSTSDDPQ